VIPVRVPVVIIGGGPAGLLLARLLQLAGIESVILERQTRQYVMARVRAGVMEMGTVAVLREAEVAERMDREGFVHEGVNLSFAGRLLRIDFAGLSASSIMVYGQTEVTKDLYAVLDTSGVTVIDEAVDVTPHDVDTGRPYVRFVTHPDGNDDEHRIDCAYVAGCDGFHGVSRSAIPRSVLREYERVYPFGWLGVLSSRNSPVEPLRPTYVTGERFARRSQSTNIRYITRVTHGRSCSISRSRGSSG
jgi:p-hydroxybenzoate 3-monooxygenase